MFQSISKQLVHSSQQEKENLLTAPYVVEDVKIRRAYCYIYTLVERKQTITTLATIMIFQQKNHIDQLTITMVMMVLQILHEMSFLWKKVDGNTFIDDLNHAYDK